MYDISRYPYFIADPPLVQPLPSLWILFEMTINEGKDKTLEIPPVVLE
jgi:hypothetical protein